MDKKYNLTEATMLALQEEEYKYYKDVNRECSKTKSFVNTLHNQNKITESVDWSYYNKFKNILDKYMSDSGEGETMASQIVTAINKLIYKWYNDGDVYDNVNSGMQGWANDLSDYANWLDKYCKPASRILDSIYNCSNDDEYENILKALADKCLDEKYLSTMEEKPKQGSIYDCEGQYEFEEQDENDEWEDYTVDFDDEEDEDEDYYDDDEYLDSMDESKTKLIKESVKSSNYIQDRADMLLSYKDAIINYIASATPNNIREYEILDATKLLERILKLCDWVNDQKQFLTKVYNNPAAAGEITSSLRDYIEKTLSKNTDLVKELTDIENIVSSTNFIKTESKLRKESKKLKKEDYTAREHLEATLQKYTQEDGESYDVQTLVETPNFILTGRRDKENPTDIYLQVWSGSYDNVTVYINQDYKGKVKSAEISWSSIGSVDVDKTKEFINHLQSAIEFVEQINGKDFSNEIK